MLSKKILRYVLSNPNCLTSDIETQFVSQSTSQQSVLGAIGYLRSQNRIQTTAIVPVRGRTEHRFV